MKKIILFLSFTFLITTVQGQTNELGISFNSGLFSFAGKSAGNSGSINHIDLSGRNYTNNPYGTGSAVCYGVSLYIKRITVCNFIFGLEAGYDALRSKITIDRIDGFNGVSVYQLSANGNTFLNENFLNFFPSVGYRFEIGFIPFDLEGGFDFGYLMQGFERGKATDENGTRYTTRISRNDITFDFRPRIQFTITWNRIGVYAGYSYGLINYMMNYKSDSQNQVNARLIRFGINFRII